jgi:hypothetical protein
MDLRCMLVVLRMAGEKEKEEEEKNINLNEEKI